MKALSHRQTLLARDVLAQLDGAPAVASVKIDGIEVAHRTDLLDGAGPKGRVWIDALAHRVTKKKPKKPPTPAKTWLGRTGAKIGAGVSNVATRFRESALGRAMQRYLAKNPETVAYHGRAEITLKDGTRFHLDERVVDEARTRWLDRASLVVGIAAAPPGVPFLGQAVTGAAGAVALTGAALVGTAAGVTQLLGGDGKGKLALASAMAQTGAKQLLIGASYLVPVIGMVFPFMSLAADAEDLAREQS